MNQDKKCPPGKILNPASGRCVKVDGKIGRSLQELVGDKQCPPGKILNKATGRCVKVDGKVGKKLAAQEKETKVICIVFKPEILILVNSSFDSNRSKASLKNRHVWKRINIKQYLDWYNMFSDSIANAFRKQHMEFMGFSAYSNKYLQIKFKMPTLDAMDMKNLPQNAAVKYALSPDLEEDHIIMYKNMIHLVESGSVKKIFSI
jgi:hypothetical protein